MGIDGGLLEILCCPLTQAPLQRLPGNKLDRLNALIAERKIKNQSKVVLEAPLEEALVTRDGKLAYPVRDSIPVLLIYQGIALAQCD